MSDTTKLRETWLPVKGYENSYHVSNLGRIKSLPKLRRNSTKILTPQVMKSGYLTVDLGDGANIKRHLIHRIVAQVFCENTENKECVNHKNGIKHDNRSDNLEWVTRSENTQHAIKNGLLNIEFFKNSQRKLTKDQVIEIRDRFSKGVKGSVLASQYSISHSTICDIIKGRSWVNV